MWRYTLLRESRVILLLVLCRELFGNEIMFIEKCGLYIEAENGPVRYQEQFNEIC
jgi:hypothetical protein